MNPCQLQNGVIREGNLHIKNKQGESLQLWRAYVLEAGIKILQI